MKLFKKKKPSKPEVPIKVQETLTQIKTYDPYEPKGCYTCTAYYEKENKCNNGRIHMPKIDCVIHERRV